MTETSDFFTRVKEAIIQVSPEVPEDRITSESSLILDLNIDSLKIAELSVILEELFDTYIFLPELIVKVEDPSKLTMGALVDYIQEEVAAG
ncbi:hypothetical protein [Synechococcus sp. PCC 7336]|uniref:hypothetical protein n=1 Tax=Synechococcus sp. PCC 7336 TaxID=195250 RepID=UPI000348C60A|nr:hypothetical protein [Synechococcus sp. PCC 7336]